LKILITGASGFIGKNLVSKLLKKKNQITVIVRNKKKIKDQEWYNRVEVFEGDIFKKKNIFFNKHYDVLIHLAWDKLDNFNSIKHHQNLEKHKRFIESALKNKIKRFIFAGTCQEYGQINGKLNENMKIKPSTSYSKSKNELRKFIFSKKKDFNITIQWIRIFYLYGKYQSKDTLFGLLDEAIKRKKKIFNMSSGEQIRDYLDIKNLCKIFSLLLYNSKVNGVVNGCSGKKIKLIDLVKKYIGKNKIILNRGYYKIPKYEQMYFWGCCKKLNKLFHND
tara:strand:- start:1273 stop:2106 length:834 start_codon:yes stop_codon:yes gene_type:complete